MRIAIHVQDRLERGFGPVLITLHTLATFQTRALVTVEDKVRFERHLCELFAAQEEGG